MAFSLEDYQRLAAEKTAEQKTIYRSQKLRGVDQIELLWTALLPGWTVPLARASGFPVKDVATYFDGLQQKAILKKTEVVGDDDEPKPTVYTMDDVARADVIDTYLDDPGAFDRLKSTLSVIGSNILDVIGLPRDINNVPEKDLDKISISITSPAVARFAILAVHATNPSEMVHQLDQQVEVAFLQGNSATIRDWINTAIPFSTLFLRLGDDSMKQALQRASQRLILLRRQESDRRHLKHFYKRDEQYQAFEDLMKSDDRTWAIHFLGAGGVGKTMLVRKITLDWVKEFDAVAARVDFDYLKADYPTLDPGMLLWAFAQDLRAHAPQESIRLFNRAERKFQELSGQIRSAMSSGLRQRATDHRDFREGISLYADALRLIPQRVVLIVDTCEELAKIGIGLTPVQNIHETFRILKALHDGPRTLKDESALPANGIPSLRVIFSGRRPLASAGTNWNCPSASQLAPRSYLKLHEVYGFTKTDAEKFLREKMEVDESLVDAIVKRSSPDTGRVTRIEWTNPNDGPPSEERCNPYDLKLYADWSKEQPPPTAEQILNTPPATQYIELRVLRRLHDPSLVEALPAVALLGHFDKRLLEHVFAGQKTKDQIGHLFDLLQQEEWINQRAVQDDIEGSNLILDVEPGIRTRLFVYYQNIPLLTDVRSRAADYLEKLTVDGNPSRLDWSLFDSAVTVLEADPDKNRVFRWWRKVDALMFSTCLPDWIKTATDRMQNEGGAAAWRDPTSPLDVPPESRLRPAVLATYASALLRSANRSELKLAWRELRDIWQEVLNKSRSVVEEMPEIEARARAGLVSASLQIGEIDQDFEFDEVDPFWGFVEKVADLPATLSPPMAWGQLDSEARVKNQLPAPFNDPQMLASIVAAAEAIVEYVDATIRKDPSVATHFLNYDTLGKTGVPALKRLFASASDLTMHSPELRHLVGFGFCLIGRAEGFLGKLQTIDSFKQALELCDFDAEPELAVSPWFDWIPPRDVASRVRLEFIRTAYPQIMSPQAVLETLNSRAGHTVGLTVSRERVGVSPWYPHLIDNERLHSAVLRLRSALEPVQKYVLSMLDRVMPPFLYSLRSDTTERAMSPFDSEADVESVCRAHQVTPPLFVTVEELRADLGDADEALANLASVLRTRATISYDTQLHIDRACVKIISKYRLREVYEKGGHILSDSPEVEDRALAWELDAQEGDRRPKSIPQIPEKLVSVEISQRPYTEPEFEKLRWLHAIWQTRYVGDPGSAASVLAWAEENFKEIPDVEDSRDAPELISVQYDCMEALVLARRYKLKLDIGTRGMPRFHLEDFNPHFSPERSLQLWLRGLFVTNALSNMVPSVTRKSAEIARYLYMVSMGIRRSAEIAMHEADLLALRFPEKATKLYRQAQEWFGESKDFRSQFIAGTSEGMCVSLNEGKKLAESVTSAFNKFAELPERETLPLLLLEPDDAFTDWGPRCWRPRFTRYLLLLIAERTKKDHALIARKLMESLLPGAIAKTTNIDLYSADLANWLANAAAPPSFLKKSWTIIKTSVPFVFGLAIIFAAVQFLLRGFTWLFSIVAPSFPSRSQWLQYATLGTRDHFTVCSNQARRQSSSQKT